MTSQNICREKGLWDTYGCKEYGCVLGIQTKCDYHIMMFPIFKHPEIRPLNCDTSLCPCALCYFSDSVMPCLPSRHCQKFPASVKSPDCSCDQPPACTAAARLLISSPGYIEGSQHRSSTDCLCCVAASGSESFSLRCTCCLLWLPVADDVCSDFCRMPDPVVFNLTSCIADTLQSELHSDHGCILLRESSFWV